MEQDPQRDAVQTAMTTAEHRSLGNVLDVIRRLEGLRERGLSSAQIAERIRLTHPNRPGGGPWSAEAVERVLEIADASRRPDTPQPQGQRVTQPVPTAPSSQPPPQATTQPIPVAPSSQPPPQAAHDHPPLRPRSAAGPAIGEDRRAPLRVEPRRYHQRPAAQPDAGLEPDRSRRWPAAAGLLTLVGLLAVGVGLYQIGFFDRFTETSDQAAPAAPQTTDGTAAGGQAAGDETGEGTGLPEDTTGNTGDPGEGETDDGETGEAADGGTDSLVIRIEPSAPETDDGIAPATATIKTDGKLYIEGAFRSESEAERFLDSAAEVFGEAALVPGYTIDPAAPDPTVSDVVLEKPVLFESGSAEIDPEYIPFLEACGDVLKLNSHIVMSVTAFTDASGSADFNLELSQQRADAVIDFYRNLDIGDDQLISTGFGEADFVADNDTEEGRQQNRRAMLELLNVMKDG